MDEPADSALGVNPFLELEGCIAVQLPKGERCLRRAAISQPGAWRNNVPGGSDRLPSLDRVPKLVGIGGGGHRQKKGQHMAEYYVYENWTIDRARIHKR
jgi:hypothetical protein